MIPFTRMTRDLRGALPVPVWPEGVGLVPLADVAPEELHALMRLAYAKGGGSVADDFAEWWAPVRGDSEFDPALCFIAENALGHVVGFALVWNSSFVKDLVVHPVARRNGVAAALLREAFRALSLRGFEKIALKVEVDNPTGAERLYQRMGFAPDEA